MAREADLLKAGRALAELQDADLDRRDRPPLTARLDALRAARTSKGRASLHRGSFALAAGAASLAAAAAWALWVQRPDPIAFAVGAEGARGDVGAWIAASSAGDLPVAFSDGSRLELRADARARVVEVTEHGARVLLERGQVGVNVVHREATRWAVVGGPFEIQVIGTRFDATWNPEEEALTVRLAEGEVAITGACLREAHRLRRGESVRLSCRDVVAGADPATAIPPSAPVGGAQVPEPPANEPAPATGGAPGAAPGSAASPTTPTSPASPISSATAEAEEGPTWRELARTGKAKDAWIAAEKEGIAGLQASLGAAELLELANLARLAGKGAEARRTYLVVRERFAGSDAAAAAAFHVGRMSFDGSGAYAEAARWFSTYLAERPGGAFAPEATGRLMESFDKSGDGASARQLAARYVERWPQGAHAALANSLISAAGSNGANGPSGPSSPTAPSSPKSPTTP